MTNTATGETICTANCPPFQLCVGDSGLQFTDRGLSVKVCRKPVSGHLTLIYRALESSAEEERRSFNGVIRALGSGGGGSE